MDVRLRWLASIAFLGALPVLVVLMVGVLTVQNDLQAMDLHQFYDAARKILDGESPYAGPPTAWGGPYPYPPLPALLTAPLTALPFAAAGLVAMLGLVLATLATLFVLGVRDWRCYGAVLLWPPVISAIQTGNLTLWLALAAALTWRYRDRPVLSAAPVAVSLAAKLFLWPLAIWLAATRRLLAATLSVGLGIALLLASWAVIGFAGLRDYPDVLQKLDRVVGQDSYTLYIAGRDAGLSSPAARSLWLFVGIALLAGMIVVARRDERRAFVLALAATLALTPIVWLHYFALLVVVVALAQPRLGFLWFVPLAMVLTPGSGHPTAFQTAWTLGVAAVVFVLALRAAPGESAAEGRLGPVGAEALP